MKKATWCWLAVLVFSAGCAVGPRLERSASDDRPVYTAYLKDKPLFAVVADSPSGSYGVTNAMFINATYLGEIRDNNTGTRVIEYRSSSGGRNLRLGERHYDFTEGRLFLVSVKSDPIRVQQLSVPEEELRHPTMTDERIATFFQEK
jgi:hypothetical protein